MADVFKKVQPIFFAWTRSFWLAVTSVLLVLDMGEPAIRSLVSLVALALATFGVSFDVDWWVMTIMDVAPVVAIVATIQQRSGAARPYTVKLNKETVQ